MHWKNTWPIGDVSMPRVSANNPGHIPLMVFPQLYEPNERKFKAPFLILTGRLSRRDGTYNVVVTGVKPFQAIEKVPASKDSR